MKPLLTSRTPTRPDVVAGASVLFCSSCDLARMLHQHWLRFAASFRMHWRCKAPACYGKSLQYFSEIGLRHLIDSPACCSHACGGLESTVQGELEQQQPAAASE